MAMASSVEAKPFSVSLSVSNIVLSRLSECKVVQCLLTSGLHEGSMHPEGKERVS